MRAVGRFVHRTKRCSEAPQLSGAEQSGLGKKGEQAML